MELIHNPRCRKSREALALLTSKNLEPEIRLYLQDFLTENELTAILKKLAIKPEALLRKGESVYKENYKGKTLTDKQWIAAMVKFPKLIERPILINEDKAAIGRPPESILDII